MSCSAVTFKCRVFEPLLLADGEVMSNFEHRMTYGESRAGRITEKQGSLQEWTSVERSSDARLSSEPQKLERPMDGTSQRGRSVTARSENEDKVDGDIGRHRVEIRRGVQPNHPCTKGPDERSDTRIVECMDGGGLEETDEFLVARGQFLGIDFWASAQSLMARRCNYSLTLWAWVEFSNELVAELEADIGRVVGDAEFGRNGTKQKARETEAISDPKTVVGAKSEAINHSRVDYSWSRHSMGRVGSTWRSGHSPNLWQAQMDIIVVTTGEKINRVEHKYRLIFARMNS
ncbi:hypothetical protein B0H13DRAFT_1868017 [Mycena leptocephala]|nr:hypothetical protein B0H13DRAFT_1868017 [Mycena leptocephala]